MLIRNTRAASGQAFFTGRYTPPSFKPLLRFCTAGILCLSLWPGSLGAGQGRYAFKTQVAPADAGYSYGILQLDYSARPAEGQHIYAMYDTDALYVQYSLLAASGLFGALYTKGHAFDWQNVNHFVDPYGRDRLKLTGRFLEGGFKGGLSRPDSTKYYLQGGFEQAWLSADDSKLSPGSTKTALTMGMTAALVESGSSFQVVPVSRLLALRYRGRLNTPAWSLNNRVVEQSAFFHELELAAARSFKLPAAFVSARATTVLNLGGADRADLPVYAALTGGSEHRYRRLAGFAFGEFRPYTFGLVNLDLLAGLTERLYVWLVTDFLLQAETDSASLKALYGSVGVHRPFKAGSGLGLLYKFSLVELFIRTDIAWAAKRYAFVDRLQIFSGIEGRF